MLLAVGSGNAGNITRKGGVPIPQADWCGFYEVWYADQI
jgi:hypothetical protein